MKKIDGFVLRSVAGESIVVGEGLGQVDFNRVISLNDTASYLWESAVESGDDFGVEQLAGLLVERYEVAEDRALTDAQSIADQWIKVGIVG